MTLLSALVEAAVQAPTGDNCQPWRFAQTSQGLTLSYDADIASSVFNIDQLPTLLGLGAAWENMQLRASQLGHQLSVEVLAPSQQEPAALQVKFNENPRCAPDPLASQIFVRHSNRWPYQRQKPAADVRQKLLACASKNVALQLRGADFFADFSPLLRQVDKLRWEHLPLVEELLAKMQLNPLAKFSSRSGLAYDTLGIGAAPLATLRWLSRKRRAAFWGPRGISTVMAVQSQLLLQRSAGVALISCNVDDPLQVIEAGRTMQRLWLTTTAHGIAMQPQASVPLLSLRAAREQAQNFAPRHQRLLTDSFLRWNSITKPPPGHFALMAFRFGYARPAAPALRKPIGHFFQESPPHA